MTKCVVLIFDGRREVFPEALDELATQGWSGRLVLKQNQTPAEAIQAKYPAVCMNHEKFASTCTGNVLESVAASPATLILIEDSPLLTDSTVAAIISSYHTIAIFYPVPFPSPEPPHPLWSLRPKQSYQFQECKDISAALNRSECCAYIEHVANYTRRDTLTSVQQVLTSIGAANCILAEHLAREVAYHQGLAPKYGA